MVILLSLNLAEGDDALQVILLVDEFQLSDDFRSHSP